MTFCSMQQAATSQSSQVHLMQSTYLHAGSGRGLDQHQHSRHAHSWRLHYPQLQVKQRLLYAQLCSRYLASSMPQEPRRSVLDLQA